MEEEEEFEQDSASITGPCVCITNFHNMRNRFRDIRKYFRDTYGFPVKDIVFNKRSVAEKGSMSTGTVIVTFNREIPLDTVFSPDKVHDINGRTVKIRPFNTDRKSLMADALVTDILSKPDSDHAPSCSLKQLHWDCWAQIFSHLTAVEIRNFGRCCSCAYQLLRTHEQVRRRSLKLDLAGFHSKGFFCTGCSYTKVKRYLLRYNLAFLQSLSINLSVLWGRNMDFNFCAFIAKHCPDLQELCLDSLGVACMKQEMTGGVKLNNLRSLVLRNTGNPSRHNFKLVRYKNNIQRFLRSGEEDQIQSEWVDVVQLSTPHSLPLNRDNAFDSDCFSSVLIAAKNLKSLELVGCTFERPFFGALPRNIEKLVLIGNFNGVPTDVIANRVGHCLKSLMIGVHALGQRTVSYHESFLKFTQLEELHLRNYSFFHDARKDTIFTPPNLRRLILDKPRNLSASDVSLIGYHSPNLTYLFAKKPCYVMEDLCFLNFCNLEELCIPQSMLFTILTGKLPLSLKRLRLPLKEAMTVGIGDGDLARPKVLSFFESILALPHLEFLETGLVFYPNRQFIIERIAMRPPDAPFLTLQHGIVRGEQNERVGDRYKFLSVKPAPMYFWEQSSSLMTTFA